MFKRKEEPKNEEPKNPEGLTHDEFIQKYHDIPELAEICWAFGVKPEQLKEEIKTLQENY